MEEKIKQILNEKINPLLSEHYGGAELVEIKDNIVYIKMLGACGNCPSAQETIENIITVKIKEQVPEVEKVMLSNCVSEELLDFARDLLKGNK